MAWADDISGVHKEIAESDAALISVLAGPGTGKTAYGLMRRVARLLEDGVDPSSILLISFTRTAAADLRDKVSGLGVRGAEKVRATTLHSFCLSLLVQDHALSLLRRNPRMLLDHEEDLLLRDLAGEWGKMKDKRQMLHDFVAGWDRCETDHPALAVLPDDQVFERLVIDWLVHHQVMLVGEVIPIVYNYLADDPMNRELGGYTNIIVDEYQDLNFLEQKLIDLLAGNPNTNVCIAGDDDQSIYAFRNARPEGILQFSARRDVTKFSIDVCGRCPRNIVEMANSLISQSPGRLQKSLVAKQQTDGYTAKLVWENLDDEVEGIVAAIAADRVSNRYELGQILVLTNRSKIGAMIKARLQGVDIPAHSYFRQEPVKAERAQIALAILRLLHGPDRVALRVILGAGGSGRFEAYARLRSLANQLKCTELEIMDRLVQKRERLPIKVPAFVQNYSAAVYELEALKGSDLRQIVDRLFAEGDPELAEIRDIAEMCLPQCDDSKQLLDKIVRRLTQLDVPENPNFVRVMSLHKSKGLTAECVYIVGALHGVLPSLKTAYSESEDKEAIEEQRRLMYVALTRATKQLVISYPRYLARADAMALGARLGESADGMQHRVHPSVYIRELGPSAPPAQAGDIWIRNYPPAS